MAQAIGRGDDVLPVDDLHQFGDRLLGVERASFDVLCQQCLGVSHGANDQLLVGGADKSSDIHFASPVNR